MNQVFWLEQDMGDIPFGDGWLSPAEFAHSRELRFAKRRDDWLLGRWTAKRTVSSFLGCGRLAAIELRAAASGAPRVYLDGDPAKLSLSLSHRLGRALCVLSATSDMLGCDLEAIEPHSPAFAADYFTPEEQELVARAPEPDRAGLLSLLWSAKESMLKALQTGLRSDTRSVNVRPEPPGMEWSRFSTQCECGTHGGWWREEGGMIRTIAASPPWQPPIAISGYWRLNRSFRTTPEPSLMTTS